jgi:hypothetical protein
MIGVVGLDACKEPAVTRIVVASLIAVTLSAGLASAQGPAAGQLPPVGDIFGYSPLVPSVDPFPTRTSGYAPSWFLPRIGGKRIYPPQYAAQLSPQVVVLPGTVVVPAEETAVLTGPVQPASPPRAWHRFGRHLRSSDQLP